MEGETATPSAVASIRRFALDRDNRYTQVVTNDPGNLVAPVDQILGHRPEDVLPPDLLLLADRGIYRARRGERSIFRTPVLGTNGGYNIVAARVASSLGGGVRFLTTVLNEHQPLAYRVAMADVVASTIGTFDGSAMAFFLVDVEFRLLAWSRECERLSAWSAGHVLGGTPPLVDNPALLGAFRRVLWARDATAELGIPAELQRRDRPASNAIVSFVRFGDQVDARAVLGILSDPNEGGRRQIPQPSLAQLLDFRRERRRRARA